MNIKFKCRCGEELIIEDNQPLTYVPVVINHWNEVHQNCHKPLVVVEKEPCLDFPCLRCDFFEWINQFFQYPKPHCRKGEVGNMCPDFSCYRPTLPGVK